MKSSDINLREWIKTFFIAEKNHRKNASKAVVNHAPDFGKEAIAKSKPVNELQRRAYRGNFFSGPSAIINPGLFKE